MQPPGNTGFPGELTLTFLPTIIHVAGKRRCSEPRELTEVGDWGERERQYICDMKYEGRQIKE
ncbi:hypothetical protein TUM17576_37830 [Enterobacter hormaechei]|nr:hypothetical protein TUM17576_37830 [Enterobacter hormaechei]